MTSSLCRLLEELLQKEKEYQQVLKATLQQRTHDLELVKVRHRPPGKHFQYGDRSVGAFLILKLCFSDISPPSIFHIPADHEPDRQLTNWLKEQGADPDTIDKVEYLLAKDVSTHSEHYQSTSGLVEMCLFTSFLYDVP